MQVVGKRSVFLRGFNVTLEMWHPDCYCEGPPEIRAEIRMQITIGAQASRVIKHP